MKTKKWAVDKNKKIGWIIDFIKKYLKLEPSESLVSNKHLSVLILHSIALSFCIVLTNTCFIFQFLYVNQAFAPAPDQIVRNIYDCYGSDGKLVLHYCKSQAWG